MKKKIIVTIGILATFSFMIASRPFAGQAGIKDNQKVYSQTEHTQDGVNSDHICFLHHHFLQSLTF